MKKYTLIVVHAYELQTEQGQLHNSTEISLIEDDVEVALKRAKKLIKKKHYRVSRITEFYDST